MQGIALATRFSGYVEASSQFELVVRPSFALIVFRLVPSSWAKSQVAAAAAKSVTDLNSLNRIFHSRLPASDLFLTQADVNGNFCIRFAVGAARTQERHIDMAWKVLCAEAEPAMKEWVETVTSPQELPGGR